MGKHIFGVRVGKVQISLSATVRIKKQKKRHLNLIVKILKKYFFVAARKAKIRHFVMVLINH